MENFKKIGFWGYPDPEIMNETKIKYPNGEWIDLDIDFNNPKTNILPESPIGKDKCDSGWFASKILEDMGFNVIQTIYENLNPKREIKISKSKLPLYEKISAITAGIIDDKIYKKEYEKAEIPADNNSKNTLFTPGFWGVPPNDLDILKLFPNTTHVYGWTRCVEAGTPADLELEMYVNPNVPTVFYAQAFCSKSQLAKYLADKYNGLYIDIDDYSSNSIKAKIEAFLKLS